MGLCQVVLLAYVTLCDQSRCLCALRQPKLTSLSMLCIINCSVAVYLVIRCVMAPFAGLQYASLVCGHFWKIAKGILELLKVVHGIKFNITKKLQLQITSYN